MFPLLWVQTEIDARFPGLLALIFSTAKFWFNCYPCNLLEITADFSNQKYWLAVGFYILSLVLQERGAYAPMSTGFAAQAKLDQLEPSCANAIVQYANISKPSWISWYAFSARDEAIQALINEMKSYYMRLPPIQHLQQLPLLQSPSTRYDYESPSLYLEPQFQVGSCYHGVKFPCLPVGQSGGFDIPFSAHLQSLNIPGDGLPRDYLNAQVNVLGSGVHEMHNQRQSHPRGRQRDFFGEGPDFTIYITINFDGGRLTKENIWDYFKYFLLTFVLCLLVWRTILGVI